MNKVLTLGIPMIMSKGGMVPLAWHPSQKFPQGDNYSFGKYWKMTELDLFRTMHAIEISQPWRIFLFVTVGTAETALV